MIGTFHKTMPVDLIMAVNLFERVYGEREAPAGIPPEDRYRFPVLYFGQIDRVLGEEFAAFYKGIGGNPDTARPSGPDLPLRAKVKAMFFVEAANAIDRIREAYINGVKASGYLEGLEAERAAKLEERVN